MTATATTRKPKAIAVSKLTDKGVVTQLARSESDRLAKVHQLCIDLQFVKEWQSEALAAADALAALIAKVDG